MKTKKTSKRKTNRKRYNETLEWIENALDSLHETGKMGSLHWRATYTEEDHKALKEA